MKNVYFGATAVFEGLDEDKKTELQGVKGVRVNGERVFVPYQSNEEKNVLELPEAVKGIRPHHYTTAIRVAAPWIGVVAVGRNGEIPPTYENEKAMGWHIRGGVTLYSVTTSGYTEIEYISLSPSSDGKLKLNRQRTLQKRIEILGAALPESMIRENMGVPAECALCILKAFSLAKERMEKSHQVQNQERGVNKLVDSLQMSTHSASPETESKPRPKVAKKAKGTRTREKGETVSLSDLKNPQKRRVVEESLGIESEAETIE